MHEGGITRPTTLCANIDTMEDLRISITHTRLYRLCLVEIRKITLGLCRRLDKEGPRHQRLDYSLDSRTDGEAGRRGVGPPEMTPREGWLGRTSAATDP